VEFDGTLLGEAVHDEEFVERVAERIGVGKMRKTLLAHPK